MHNTRVVSEQQGQRRTQFTSQIIIANAVNADVSTTEQTTTNTTATIPPSTIPVLTVAHSPGSQASSSAAGPVK